MGKKRRSGKKVKIAAPSWRTPKPRFAKRLVPGVRAEQILKGAVRFFAEHGFGGQTRELANELGISKGLLYRYFSSKDALIERVYAEVFLHRWKPQWHSILTDRHRPLIERLKAFYLDYAKVTLEYEWGRIYLHAGLAGASINRRYARLAYERIFKPVIGEVRHEFRAPPIDQVAITEPESELLWSLHGAIFYIGIRKWIYHFKMPTDIDAAIEQLIEGFYLSAKNVIRKDLERDKLAEESGSRTHQRPARGLSRI